MKIKITHDDDIYSAIDEQQYFHFQLKGTGSPEYPCVMTDNSNTNFKNISVIILNSKEKIKIDKFQVDSMEFEYCMNFKLENTKVKKLNLCGCSKCEIQDVNVKKELNLKKCYKISLNGVKAKKYVDVSSINTTMRDCDFKKRNLDQTQLLQF
ncbi:MAG: hypothetical protein ACFFAS_09955 [Promethearchaeota archaeon]